MTSMHTEQDDKTKAGPPCDECTRCHGVCFETPEMDLPPYEDGGDMAEAA